MSRKRCAYLFPCLVKYNVFKMNSGTLKVATACAGFIHCSELQTKAENLTGGGYIEISYNKQITTLGLDSIITEDPLKFTLLT